MRVHWVAVPEALRARRVNRRRRRRRRRCVCGCRRGSCLQRSPRCAERCRCVCVFCSSFPARGYAARIRGVALLMLPPAAWALTDPADHDVAGAPGVLKQGKMHNGYYFCAHKVRSVLFSH
jgi:hypothetical protein